MGRVTSKIQIGKDGKTVEHLDPTTGNPIKIERFDRDDRRLEVEYIDRNSGESTHKEVYDPTAGRIAKIVYYDQSSTRGDRPRSKWTIRIDHFDLRTGVRTQVETFPPRPTAADTWGPILLSRMQELEVLERVVDGHYDVRGMDPDSSSAIEAVRARLFHELKALIRDAEKQAVARNLGVWERLGRVREPRPGVGWPPSR